MESPKTARGKRKARKKFQISAKVNIQLENVCCLFAELEMSGVTSRSGRVIKKSTKLMDFTSPDDIETVKAKKMASASRKLNMVRRLETPSNYNNNKQYFLDAIHSHKDGTGARHFLRATGEAL